MKTNMVAVGTAVFVAGIILSAGCANPVTGVASQTGSTGGPGGGSTGGGVGSPTPTPPPTAAEILGIVIDAVDDSANGGFKGCSPAVASSNRITDYDGACAVDDAEITLTNIRIDSTWTAVSGTAQIISGVDSAHVFFDGSVCEVSYDGHPLGADDCFALFEPPSPGGTSCDPSDPSCNGAGTCDPTDPTCNGGGVIDTGSGDDGSGASGDDGSGTVGSGSGDDGSTGTGTDSGSGSGDDGSGDDGSGDDCSDCRRPPRHWHAKLPKAKVHIEEIVP